VFYDIGLWTSYRVGSINKLADAYVKCIKMFFGYHKYYSVTSMLMDFGLPSFSTVLFNGSFHINSRLSSSVNSLVQIAVRV